MVLLYLIPFFDSIGNKLRINHYWCKSEEDLLKKYERGWVPEREKIKIYHCLLNG